MTRLVLAESFSGVRSQTPKKLSAISCVKTGPLEGRDIPVPQSATRGGGAQFADGTMQQALPEYTKLECSAVYGNSVELSGTDLRCLFTGQAVVELRCSVAHNWGSNVIFGWGVDGGAPQFLGQVQINSNDLVFVIQQYLIAVTEGQVLQLYISSDFEWQNFTWVNGTLLFVAQ